MKYPILSCDRKSDLNQFIDFWSSFYSYAREDLYANSIKKKVFSSQDINFLFEWKNGTRLSKSKQKTVDGIVSKLNIVNSLKKKLNKDLFAAEFGRMSAIWKIFLLHIIAPKKYPIFDQHVYRAYFFLKNKVVSEIPSSNKIKEKIYEEEYLPYFNGLVRDGVSRKEVDEALWAFGKFLKTPYGKASIG